MGTTLSELITQYGFTYTYLVSVVTVYIITMLFRYLMFGNRSLVTHGIICSVFTPFAVLVWFRLAGVI